MADVMTLKLVTPHARLYDGPAAEFTAPGRLGEFGVLPNHDPWFVALGLGTLAITEPKGSPKEFFVNGGYCQIDDDHVVILAEVCEPGHKIDVERAKAARQRAEDRIKNAQKDSGIDVARAEIALRRALTRLEIAAKAIK